MQSHRTNTKSGTLMSSHCNVWPNATSKIRQHSNCSAILPVILSRDSLKILVQKRFPHWSKLLICFTICNSKKGCNSFDQERLQEFKGFSINLLKIHSKILVPRLVTQSVCLLHATIKLVHQYDALIHQQ